MPSSESPSPLSPPIAGGAVKPPIARRLYAGKLGPTQLVDTLRHSDRLFPSALVPRGKLLPQPLPRSVRRLFDVELITGSRSYDLTDYLALNRIAGLLVLKDGEVVREDYELGLKPTDRWASFSLAKSICSTLVGCAIGDGLIGGVLDPIGRYLPALAASAYAEVTIRDVLRMSSGVRWSETYLDPASERRRFLELQISGQPGSLLTFMAGLQAHAPPGARFNYNTGETFLIGALLEAATGRSLARYLGERLWSHLGMDREACWWLESPQGNGIGGSGFSATLRDYARFARFVLDDGVADGVRLVPAGWLTEATTEALLDGTPVG